MKIFVSISSYDSILDASIASTLCKKKMKNHEVYTSLSYSKKDLHAEEYQKYFDAINYVDGKEIFEKTVFDNEIPIRQFYSMYVNIKKAIESNFDFVIILNSGSWFLDGQKIDDIISNLKNYVIGCRAMKYSNMKTISCDDHFIFININELKNKKIIFDNFLNFIPFDFKYGGIHTILNNFFNKFSYKDIFIYSDINQSVDTYNQYPRYLHPLNFDKQFRLLHSNKNEKKNEPIRYSYLNYYAPNYFDDFIMGKINEWQYNIKLVSNNDGNFFYKESLLQKIKKFLKHSKRKKKDWGFLENIV